MFSQQKQQIYFRKKEQNFEKENSVFRSGWNPSQ